MPTPPTEWMVAFGALLAVLVATCVWQGPYRALGVTVALSFLFPVWTKYDAAGLPFDLRTSAAIAGLLLFTAHRSGKIFNHLTLLDVGIVMLVLIHAASDAMHGTPLVLSSLRAYGEWALPYVAGRYAIRRREDLEFLAPVVVSVAILLGLAGAWETLNSANVFEPVFGLRPLEDVPRGMARFGWKRAYGIARHPNYFGPILVLLLPWFAELWACVRFAAVRAICIAGALVVMAGGAATVSRGTIAGLLGVPVTAVALTSRRSFAVIGGIATVVMIAAMVNYQRLDELMHELGEDKTSSKRLIEIDEKTVAYTGTSTHYRVVQIYGPIIGRVGPLGAGTEATNEFPPNVPGLPKSAKTVKMIPAVDNGFILMGLRFGWFGLFALVFILLAAIWQFLSLRNVEGLRFFAISMAAATAVYCAILWAVWMSYDFAFVYLWTIGLSSALQCSVMSTKRRRLDPWASQRSPSRR